MESSNDSLVTFNPDSFPFDIKAPESNSTGFQLSYLIAGIGIVIAVVGLGFIVFGPETIYYNRYDGPTFVQFLQMYPGPIATVGFLMITGAQYLGNKSSGLNELDQALAIELKARGVDAEKMPEGYELKIQDSKNSGYLSVGLKKVAKSQDIHQPADALALSNEEAVQRRDR